MEPAFTGQFAGVLEHVRGNGQVMDGTVACICKFQNEKFIERVWHKLSGAPHSGQFISRLYEWIKSLHSTIPSA